LAGAGFPAPVFRSLRERKSAVQPRLDRICPKRERCVPQITRMPGIPQCAGTWFRAGDTRLKPNHFLRDMRPTAQILSRFN
jgi:hypothetical protein